MIAFFVPGIPKPGGSKRGFYNPKSRRVIITEDCKKSADWKSVVAYTARQKYAEVPIAGPLILTMEFVFPRPKSHFNSKGNLKPSAPFYHTIKPDATKVVRSTEDALKGILWWDDSQVAKQIVVKRYGDMPGVHISTELITE